jgi:hypothetical protein
MTADECVWIPEITKGRRVSTMFHSTTCGRKGAPTIGAHEQWKHCPYCGAPILISTDALRLRVTR